MCPVGALWFRDLTAFRCWSACCASSGVLATLGAPFADGRNGRKGLGFAFSAGFFGGAALFTSTGFFSVFFGVVAASSGRRRLDLFARCGCAWCLWFWFGVGVAFLVVLFCACFLVACVCVFWVFGCCVVGVFVGFGFFFGILVWLGGWWVGVFGCLQSVFALVCSLGLFFPFFFFWFGVFLLLVFFGGWFWVLGDVGGCGWRLRVGVGCLGSCCGLCFGVVLGVFFCLLLGLLVVGFWVVVGVGWAGFVWVWVFDLVVRFCGFWFVFFVFFWGGWVGLCLLVWGTGCGFFFLLVFGVGFLVLVLGVLWGVGVCVFFVFLGFGLRVPVCGGFGLLWCGGVFLRLLGFWGLLGVGFLGFVGCVWLSLGVVV